jgi:hypothetical protein
MNTIKQKIALRHSANREIIEILSDMVERYPDLRFGQILAITDAIQYVPDSRPYIDTVDIKDPFNEESVDMWIRMRDKMMELNRNNKNVEE